MGSFSSLLPLIRRIHFVLMMLSPNIQAMYPFYLVKKKGKKNNNLCLTFQKTQSFKRVTNLISLGWKDTYLLPFLKHQCNTTKSFKMLAMINRLLEWFKSLFWKEEMELTLVGLQVRPNKSNHQVNTIYYSGMFISFSSI